MHGEHLPKYFEQISRREKYERFAMAEIPLSRCPLCGKDHGDELVQIFATFDPEKLLSDLQKAFVNRLANQRRSESQTAEFNGFIGNLAPSSSFEGTAFFFVLALIIGLFLMRRPAKKGSHKVLQEVTDRPRDITGVMWCPVHSEPFLGRGRFQLNSEGNPVISETLKEADVFYLDARIVKQAEEDNDTSWLRYFGGPAQGASIQDAIRFLQGQIRRYAQLKRRLAFDGVTRFLGFTALTLLLFGVSSSILTALGLEIDPNVKVIRTSLRYFASSLMELFAVLLMLVIFWIGLEGRTLDELGLRLKRQGLLQLATGAITGFVLITAIFALGLVMNAVKVGTAQTIEWPQIAGIVVWFFIAATTEELLFRGYVLRSLVISIGPVTAVGVSSFLYALLHIGNPGADIMPFIGILFHGIFLSFLLLRTHSLWIPIGLHWMWNVTLGVIYGLPVSGFVFDRILASRLTSTGILFSPREFGPESGIVAIVTFFVGVIVLERAMAIINSKRRA